MNHGPPLDERVARLIRELVDLVEPEGIAVGSLTIHFHEGQPHRTEVRKTRRIMGGVDQLVPNGVE